MIDENLLKMLVCPESKAPLKLVGEELVCEKSQLAYPIIDGIPILLLEEARKTNSEKNGFFSNYSCSICLKPFTGKATRKNKWQNTY